VPANQLVPVLRPLVDPKSYLAAHDESNMIIISDRAANVDRLMRIIKRIDVAGTGEIQMVHLEYADARDVVAVIDGLMKSTTRKGAPGEEKFQAVVDERTNSLLLAGDQGDILRVKSMIAYLDTPVQAEGATQVVFLRFAKAKDLAAILSGSGVAFEAPGERKPPQRQAAAKSEVNIQADESNNALVITASPQVMKALQDVIRRLDIRRAQVVIEAVIAEISNDKSAELGIQWRSTDGTADTNGYIGGTNFGGSNGINALSVNPLAVGDGFSLGYFQGTTKILGKEILNLGAVVHALAGDGDANILSTPTLVTMDNEEATFSVGKNVPFLTGSYTSTGSAASGSSSTPSNPFQTIERKDVGLLLKVKPQINEGDTIRLDIEQETSSISPDTVGSDIITNTRKIKTNVMVEDGKILVLGGLIQDDVTESVKKVPLLGDIPLLGALFRYTSSTHNKRNLMVFLRPTVLRNEDASDRITFDKYDFMRRLQQNAAESGIKLMPGETTPVLPERATE
jgi:general secretion pathway protein D